MAVIASEQKGLGFGPWIDQRAAFRGGVCMFSPFMCVCSFGCSGFLPQYKDIAHRCECECDWWPRDGLALCPVCNLPWAKQSAATGSSYPAAPNE